MQKGFAGIFILIGILILAAIGSAVYLSLPLQKAQPLVTQEPTSQAPLTSPSGTINQSEQMSEWKVYQNGQYNFTIQYPSRLTVNAQLPSKDFVSSRGGQLLYRVSFYSPEASSAKLPSQLDPKDHYNQFVEQYTSIDLEVHLNPGNLPLEDNLRRIYSNNSGDPNKSTFDIMKPNLKAYSNGPTGSLVYSGYIRGEQGGKSVFISHNSYIYIITLYSGPEGSNYSSSAEKIFDSMVATLKFNQ